MFADVLAAPLDLTFYDGGPCHIETISYRNWFLYHRTFVMKNLNQAIDISCDYDLQYKLIASFSMMGTFVLNFWWKECLFLIKRTIAFRKRPCQPLKFWLLFKLGIDFENIGYLLNWEFHKWVER